ncbi:MAG: hypothetical protein EBU66_19355, partial [Bacteroidetes bacterium]|nr:hypothetical protein [Bacteroidota bacterium]
NDSAPLISFISKRYKDIYFIIKLLDTLIIRCKELIIKSVQEALYNKNKKNDYAAIMCIGKVGNMLNEFTIYNKVLKYNLFGLENRTEAFRQIFMRYKNEFLSIN